MQYGMQIRKSQRGNIGSRAKAESTGLFCFNLPIFHLPHTMFVLP